MRPVQVQDEIEVLSSFVKVLPLNHECSKEEAHFNVHFTTSALYCLVKALLGLDLQPIAQAELGKLLPFAPVVWLINQVINEILLSILNVAHSIEF